MADNIIQATELIQRANDILAKHSGYLKDAATSLNQYVNSAKLPSDYVNSLKSVDDLNKKIVKSTKDVEREQKKLQRERLAELRLQKKREVAFDKYERQLKREERQLNRTQGLYNRIQRGVTAVTRTYNDLAAKKALNGKLTQQEELQLTKLEAKLNKYQGVLKKVDSNIGKYQRNVGNYASGWNGLSNSINQLTREAPAFANSVQTGFMALSNNIPILTDEISRLVQANKALQAEGKPTTSVFKQILGSIFSLQTAMSLGITLLVLYGKEIGEWASSVFGASSAADRMAENTAKINEESAKLSSQTIPQFKALVQIATDVTESEERRADAIRELNQQYPDFNANILKEGDNTGIVNSAIDTYIQKLQQKAKAQASMNLIQEKYNELIVKEQENEQKRQNVLDQVNANRKLNNKELFETQEEAIAYLDELNKRFEEQNKNIPESQRASNAYKWSIDGLNASNEELSEIQDEINELMQIYIDNVDLSTNSIKSNTDAKRENNRVDDDTFAILEGTIPYYEIIIEGLKEQQKQISRTRQEWHQYQLQIDEFTNKLEVLKDTLYGVTDAAEGTSKIDKVLDDLVKGFKLDSDSKEEIKGNWTDTFQSVTDIARRAFGIINQISEASFQRQFERLEQQKNTAIQFAGESTSARAEIERQYDERRKQIQNQEARQKKAMALFDITVDTASAVVRALPNIPLSIAIGALGAAQLAFVASQQTPQFWQGGEVGSMQQIMVNDDPYGKKGANYKEVIEKPNGDILTPQGKNVKMTVPKGTIVHPTYDAFINSLDNELLSNNIMPIGQNTIMPMIVNKGLTKGEVMEVMNSHANRLVDTINKQHGINISIDENGIHKSITKKGHTSKIMNARWTGKGTRV